MQKRITFKLIVSDYFVPKREPIANPMSPLSKTSKLLYFVHALNETIMTDIAKPIKLTSRQESIP